MIKNNKNKLHKMKSKPSTNENHYSSTINFSSIDIEKKNDLAKMEKMNDEINSIDDDDDDYYTDDSWFDDPPVQSKIKVNSGQKMERIEPTKSVVIRNTESSPFPKIPLSQTKIKNTLNHALAYLNIYVEKDKELLRKLDSYNENKHDDLELTLPPVCNKPK